jgi:hypothetical protein
MILAPFAFGNYPIRLQHRIICLRQLFGIIRREVQAPAFLANLGRFDREIGASDDVAQFAEFGGDFRFAVKVFRLFEYQLDAALGSLQPQVAAHDTHEVGHQGLHLAEVVGDEHPFLGEFDALLVPFRDLFLKIVALPVFLDGFEDVVGIDDPFEQAVGCQTIRPMQPRTADFAHGIQTADARMSMHVDQNPRHRCNAAQALRESCLW